MNRIRTAAAGLALAALAAASAQAHAKLVGADPSAGGVARPGLESLSLAFSEPVSAALTGATVTDARGAAVPSSARLKPKTDATLLVMLKAPLKPGVYTVAWRAVASDDGHRTTGVYSFTVR
jgi:methionine-rich copper-binding protein CopC